jgi:alpha-N-arabinofuranosidase
MHRLRLLPLLLVAALLAAPGTGAAQNAEIKIDVDRTIGEVDSLLYGNFVEHLGRNVYGGIYDPDSPLANEQGFRTDVMQATRDLNVSLMRYPGGNFVSNYNWKDGVGEERPNRLELAWSRIETNEFGTNEFMDFVDSVDTEPYFAVNLGTGTIEEAQQWVEYTNYEGGTYYSELRKEHGHEEPYDIKYWSLGNEMDGYWQIGHLNAEDYSKKAREAAKMMTRTDPDISLVATGASNFRPDATPMHWNRIVLEELKDVVDYIALHIYVGNPNDDYYNFQSTPHVMEQRTELVEGLIDIAMQDAEREDEIKIAWDEYNVWYRARSGSDMEGETALEERYNLSDALVIAGFLNGFIRNADIVKMANLAQLVNVIGTMFTTPDDMFKQTIYYPLQLYAEHAYGTSLDVHVNSDTYDTDEFFIGLGEQQTQQTDVPYLDVSATYQDDGEVIINVVNRHRDRDITTDLISQTGMFEGPFEVYEINGPGVKTRNNFEEQPVQTEQLDDVQGNGESFTYTFPAHSVTMLKGRIEQ